VVKNDSRGHRIVKEHRDSARPIDLAVAAVMAFAAASTVEPEPQLFVSRTEHLHRTLFSERQRPASVKNAGHRPDGVVSR
jgi:hypothetical protein